MIENNLALLALTELTRDDSSPGLSSLLAHHEHFPIIRDENSPRVGLMIHKFLANSVSIVDSRQVNQKRVQKKPES